MSSIVAIAVVAFLISAAVCFLVVRGYVASPQNNASERSLHLTPTPRGGGLGIVTSFLFIALFIGASNAFIATIVLVWLLGSLDDWIGVSATKRLFVHAICCVFLALIWLPTQGVLEALLVAMLLGWSLNLFNFMDGADGIAATAAIVGGGVLGALAYWSDSNALGGALHAAALSVAMMAIAISAATAGFLVFNFPPSKLFMGDGGSTVLGFALAAIAIYGCYIGLWPMATPIALFAPFWADATFTLIRRTLQGNNPTIAHRDHLYQRLVLAGLGHRGLLAWMAAWFALSATLAIFFSKQTTLSQESAVAIALAFGLAYVTISHLAVKHPPINLLLNPRAPTALAFDLFAVAFSWAALFWVRFNSNFDSANYAASDVIRSLAYVIPIHAIVFIAMGLYRGIWRFASLPDMWLIMRAAFVAAAGTGLVFLLLRPDSFIFPRFVLAAQPFLLIILMGGARMAVRSWKEHRLYGLSSIRGEPVIVLGAGNAAANLIRQLQRSDLWRPVALLDDDRAKQGARLFDTPVVGNLNDVGRVARRFGAQHAIVAMPNATHRERRRAVQLASEAKLATLTVPAYDELIGENDAQARLRAIELEDLLGRDPVSLDTAGLAAWFNGKTVLVTGAGGSIGRELCTQVVRFRPERIVLLDISEFAAHDIHEQLQQHFDPKRIEVYVADVRNKTRISEILAAETPAIVFHAAAYKHVPMTETVNAWEAVRNNTYGTLAMAECAHAANVEKFVLVSTDKAVRASSIMGASKRLAEIACMNLPVKPTEFVGVRFGNVLGSNGSVIPKFRKQIEAGGPVTVTHAEMTRYFMSIPEAAQLVLQAGLLGKAGSLYVLDMGEPVKIVDLARELIRLARGREDAVQIVFTGLRRGEKMHEELIGDSERFESTQHEKVRRVITEQPIEISLNDLREWLQNPAPQNVHAALQGWVKDFRPPAV
jgi:FlaA1/EpsC-like NDP-sugar epimerase/UDP-N-acetylmuramyl pentapeptide phosphotransferase/UDP-N-acetylglucosamine-1-phosphate transferase